MVGVDFDYEDACHGYQRFSNIEGHSDPISVIRDIVRWATGYLEEEQSGVISIAFDDRMAVYTVNDVALLKALFIESHNN